MGSRAVPPGWCDLLHHGLQPLYPAEAAGASQAALPGLPATASFVPSFHPVFLTLLAEGKLLPAGAAAAERAELWPGGGSLRGGTPSLKEGG